MTEDEFDDLVEEQLEKQGCATYTNEDGRLVILTTDLLRSLLEAAEDAGRDRVRILIKQPSPETKSTGEYLQ